VYTLQNSLTNVNVANQPNTFRVYIRVAVCDPTTSMGLAGLESNCTKYGSIYKPEGLMQQYANKVRYGVLSYLNTNTGLRQGGVLREPMRFIGPTYPQPLSSAVTTNATPEWDPATGVQSTNPDPTTASASNVSESGVLNYLNKFGEYAASVGNYKNTYMSGDNVSELYYAALRYFENLGNVPEWANSPTTTELDGFPAVATWSTSASASSTAADPILYTCQQNFILGIGDDHTHFDYNVGGSTATGQYPPTRPVPSTVGADALNQASTWTANLQNLETLEAGSSSSLFPTTPWWYFHNPTGGPTTDTDATYFIAGLAYGAHVNDIRPDLADTQTISTYWLDVEEYGYPENLNPYDMAAKYGGFTVPSGYTISNTTPLTAGEYDTSGNTMLMGPTLSYTQNLPDNYFLAGNASAMVSGLSSAVAKIASYIKPLYSNAFSFSGTSVAASTNTESFASEYFPATWTSTITGSTITFDSSGTPTITPQWSTDTTLLTQLAGTGWQSSGRNVATWNGSAGVAFEATALGATTPGAALLATLNKPSYSTGTSSTQLLNYLRGDRTNEVGSTVSGSSQSLRARTLLLGDIVDASLTPVSTPQQVFSDANNPGYAKFKSNWANRPTMVYAGANDGMVHGFVGSSGAEQFAYVPSALFQGPSGTPVVNGLAALGNPAYAHRFYVDATPVAYDIDLGNTGGTKGTPNWHTLLIGGLGKGGESFYAIDVTDPANMNTESVVAGKVKWEFSNSTSGVGGTLGYSFGTPVVVKTVQYGWVVAFTSGYDGSSTVGYLYIVNPATGALLQKIATPSASSGLTQASAYVKDYSDYTADSVYVGDLNGQLWRFDLTAASGTYPAPTQIATLQDASGNAQPVTTAPLIEISPTTRERYVMVGTGQLLSSNDMSTVNPQTFYAILDGTSGGFNPDPTPIMRSLLTPVTDVTAGITTLPAAFKGWYYDLGLDSASGVAWRVDQNPIAYNGIVSFSALLPAITDPCKPSGHSEVYAVNYATAKSVIQASSTSSTIVAYYSIASAVTSEKFFMNNGNPELVVGCASGCVTPIPASLNTPIATRLLNWREVPSAE
jgi:type IV pilus assembly protein PilY1